MCDVWCKMVCLCTSLVSPFVHVPFTRAFVHVPDMHMPPQVRLSAHRCERDIWMHDPLDGRDYTIDCIQDTHY
jgi:hypothetical protein